MAGMRALKWSVLAIVGVALLFVGGVVLQHLIVTAGTVYPTAETQSSFFKTYSSDDTIALFDLKRGGSRSGRGPSSAGQGFATHQKLIDIRFFIKPNARDAVPKALSEDAADQLLRSGAKIVATENTAEGKVLLRYVCGHTEGTIVIEPLKIGPFENPVPAKPPADQLPVTAHVDIQEKWFKAVPDVQP